MNELVLLPESQLGTISHRYKITEIHASKYKNVHAKLALANWLVPIIGGTLRRMSLKDNLVLVAVAQFLVREDDGVQHHLLRDYIHPLTCRDTKICTAKSIRLGPKHMEGMKATHCNCDKINILWLCRISSGDLMLGFFYFEGYDILVHIVNQ